MVPSEVRDGSAGGSRGPPNKRGGAELRRLCGVCCSGDVPGEGGEGGGVLCWRVLGGQGHGG